MDRTVLGMQLVYPVEIFAEQQLSVISWILPQTDNTVRALPGEDSLREEKSGCCALIKDVL